jgi:hypothetical protein
MAEDFEISFARDVIRAAIEALRWAASDEGLDDEDQPVVLPGLRDSLAAAVEEVRDTAFAQADKILAGQDPDYPIGRVSDALDSVGWSGASRDFKEQALEEAGRQEVMRAVDQGGPKPPRRIWKKFLNVLNAALGSLTVIPGVEPIKELKDFAHAATSD